MGSLEKKIADSPEQSNDMETGDLIMRGLVRLSIFGEEHFVQTVGLSSPGITMYRNPAYPAIRMVETKRTKSWSICSVPFFQCIS